MLVQHAVLEALLKLGNDVTSTMKLYAPNKISQKGKKQNEFLRGTDATKKIVNEVIRDINIEAYRRICV